MTDINKNFTYGRRCFYYQSEIISSFIIKTINKMTVWRLLSDDYHSEASPKV